VFGYVRGVTGILSVFPRAAVIPDLRPFPLGLQFAVVAPSALAALDDRRKGEVIGRLIHVVFPAAVFDGSGKVEHVFRYNRFVRVWHNDPLFLGISLRKAS
jgi:hypothetical protein